MRWGMCLPAEMVKLASWSQLLRSALSGEMLAVSQVRSWDDLYVDGHIQVAVSISTILYMQLAAVKSPSGVQRAWPGGLHIQSAGVAIPASFNSWDLSLEEVVNLLSRVGIQGTSSQFVGNHATLE